MSDPHKQRSSTRNRYVDAMVVTFAFALVVLTPPTPTVWATESTGWLLPHAVWAGLIAVTALIGFLRR